MELVTEDKEQKKTPLGPIPSDWISAKFDEVIDKFSSGATPYRRVSEYYTGEHLWVSSSELNYGIINDTKEKITDEAIRKTNLHKHPEGTFLIAITGLEAAGTRERCGILGEEATTNQSCMALYPNNDKLLTDYLFYFYSLYGDFLAFNYCQGTKQQSYTAGIVRILPINIPPTLEEQQAIAEALSDVDELIRSLDRLIQKKEAIKKGVMQQLLTGKKRLPGFDGCWEVKKLGDVLSVQHGKSQKQVQANDGDYPILATGGQIGKSKDYLYNKPSVLIGRKGTIDKPQYADKPFWTIDTLFYTEVKKNAIPKFLYYEFLLIDWRSYNEASGVPSLNSSTIENIEVIIPDDLAEQKAIVNILDDMDRELLTLRQKREKYKQIKQGMMQELLTGKTRLV